MELGVEGVQEFESEVPKEPEATSMSLSRSLETPHPTDILYSLSYIRISSPRVRLTACHCWHLRFPLTHVLSVLFSLAGAIIRYEHHPATKSEPR